MNRTPVESSNVLSVGYDDQTQTLEIQFKGGGIVYQYTGVPRKIFDDLLKSNSKGQFVHKYIRNVYPTVKVAA